MTLYRNSSMCVAVVLLTGVLMDGRHKWTSLQKLGTLVGAWIATSWVIAGAFKVIYVVCSWVGRISARVLAIRIQSPFIWKRADDKEANNDKEWNGGDESSDAGLNSASGESGFADTHGSETGNNNNSLLPSARDLNLLQSEQEIAPVPKCAKCGSHHVSVDDQLQQLLQRARRS